MKVTLETYRKIQEYKKLVLQLAMAVGIGFAILENAFYLSPMSSWWISAGPLSAAVQPAPPTEYAP